MKVENDMMLGDADGVLNRKSGYHVCVWMRGTR